jgi:hypothetical protein
MRWLAEAHLHTRSGAEISVSFAHEGNPPARAEAVEALDTVLAIHDGLPKDRDELAIEDLYVGFREAA